MEYHGLDSLSLRRKFFSNLKRYIFDIIRSDIKTEFIKEVREINIVLDGVKRNIEGQLNALQGEIRNNDRNVQKAVKVVELPQENYVDGYDYDLDETLIIRQNVLYVLTDTSPKQIYLGMNRIV